jgi:two-component system response regulator HydG
MILEDSSVAPPLDAESLMAGGITPIWVKDLREMEGRLAECPVEVVLLKVPRLNRGMLASLRRLRTDYPLLPLILLTQDPRATAAVAAMKAGVTEYRIAPLTGRGVLSLLRRYSLPRVPDDTISPGAARVALSRPLIGRSASMRRVYDLIHLCARSNATVLIRGETGTGKELVARAIHDLSHRHGGPFVAVNCGALPEGLLEAELFGYEKGAFTGALRRHRGYLEQVHGGTLFLDEVGDLSPRVQLDLLRVLEEKAFTRLGGRTPISVDFRLICATHKDLEEACRRGELREDFYYRIHVVNIFLPPLRERKEDIPLLAYHALKQAASTSRLPVHGISPKAMAVLRAYHWPGNVRELQNVIQRALVTARGTMITPKDLSFIREERGGQGLTLKEMERAHIRRILRDTEGNISQAARILGIGRSTLVQKLKRHGLDAHSPGLEAKPPT